MLLRFGILNLSAMSSTYTYLYFQPKRVNQVVLPPNRLSLPLYTLPAGVGDHIMLLIGLLLPRIPPPLQVYL